MMRKKFAAWGKADRRARKAAALMAAVLAGSAVLMAGCEKTPESIINNIISNLPVSAQVETEPAFGMVAATDKLTYGLSSAGLLSYTGRSNGRAACYDWRGVAFVLPVGDGTLGLTTDGKVLAAGEVFAEEVGTVGGGAQSAGSGGSADGTVPQSKAELFKSRIQSRSDIAAICANYDDVFALTRDGHVVSTSEDGGIALIKGIKYITAGGTWFAAADGRGRVYTFGDGAPDVSALAGKELVQLVAGSTAPAEGSESEASGGRVSYLVGVTAGGELISTLAEDPFNGAADCARAFTCPCGGTTYIDKNGVLHSNCKVVVGKEADIQAAASAAGKDGKPAKIQWFSCSGDHAAVSFESGKVLAFGENGYLQCRTGNWQLLPFENSGYIYGISPGTKGSDGKDVRTGDSFTLADGTSGTAVILGDVDCNGSIDGADLELLRAAIAGSTSLSPAAQQAANIVRDSIAPGSIDTADLEQLRYHLQGFTIIDQFIKSDPYRDKVADAERVNGDVSGFMTLDGTNIDAPLMYGADWYYHYHHWTGYSDELGSVYLYYPNLSKNTVITGHNVRRAGLILHDLHKIQDNYAPSYGDYANRLWTLNLWGETGLYEVFSMYEEKPESEKYSSLYYNTNYPLSMEQLDEAKIDRWITYQQDRTQLSYQVDVDTTDRFVTVCTCADLHVESDKGGRLYFFLRRADGH